MYENLLKLIQQAETADRIGKIENVVGMSRKLPEADPVLVICYDLQGTENCQGFLRKW